jgi:hypothetical protein
VHPPLEIGKIDRGSSTVLTYIREESAPMPGNVMSRRQIGSILTCCCTALSKTAICSRSCRQVASSGRTIKTILGASSSSASTP